MEGTTTCCRKETHGTLDICVPCSFNTGHQFLVPKPDFSCLNRDQYLTHKYHEMIFMRRSEAASRASIVASLGEEAILDSFNVVNNQVYVGV